MLMVTQHKGVVFRLVASIGLWFGVFMTAGCNELSMGNKGPSDAYEDKRQVALIHAIGNEDLAAVDASLAQGADINAYDKYRNTPLHWALNKKGIKAETIEHLLKKGANSALGDQRNRSPIWLLANSNRPDLLETMLRNGGNPNFVRNASSPLGEATLYQREDIIHVLLKYGADVNAVDEFGRNFVCSSAAAVGRFDLIVRYLEHGLNADLIGCARMLEIRAVSAESGQEKWKQKARELLKLKGVSVPPPSRPEIKR